MKVVILAGGFGTRLSEYTKLIPKPMVEIGNKPILWHIMNHYARYGYKDFIIALGYKGDVIKNYFSRYYTLSNDFTINLKNNKIDYINERPKDWVVSLVDTGESSMTGGRILRLKDLIGKDDFMVTYGDAVSDVNIAELVKEYKTSGALAMVTSVHPTARFGELTIDEEHFVRAFKEKPQINQGWVNGGFFVLNYKVFDYIKDDSTVFEKEPLEKLASDGELKTYCHEGFWQCMDTIRDRDYLNNLWSLGNAPWTK
ncbi:MAG: glucose-1-phosphate cytidylyltransferase [Bacteroidales bacterium]|nr:glucose-1-phosphate cytidylyltransferase [Bacteroidales bacterium]